MSCFPSMFVLDFLQRVFATAPLDHCHFHTAMWTVVTCACGRMCHPFPSLSHFLFVFHTHAHTDARTQNTYSTHQDCTCTSDPSISIDSPILQPRSTSALSDEPLKPTCLWWLLCQPSSSDLPHISSTASLPPLLPPHETLMPVHLLLLPSVVEYIGWMDQRAESLSCVILVYVLLCLSFVPYPCLLSLDNPWANLYLL